MLTHTPHSELRCICGHQHNLCATSACKHMLFLIQFILAIYWGGYSDRPQNSGILPHHSAGGTTKRHRRKRGVWGHGIIQHKVLRWVVTPCNDVVRPEDGGSM